MGQDNPEESKIPKQIQRLLEKRESLLREQENEINNAKSDGLISRRESARIGRRSLAIESIDKRMARSGFVPPQTSTVTSKTTFIPPSMMALGLDSGFNISPRRGGGGGGTATVGHPFKITIKSSGNITVDGGSVNSVVPFNLFNGLNQTEFPVGSGLRYVILRATASDSRISSAEIQISNSAASGQEPVAFGLPTTVQFTLGIVANQKVYQVVYDNIIITGRQHYIVDKQTPLEIGELPYIIYYIWG